MKIGDKVTISSKNPNHLGYGACAYSGVTGIVTDIMDDNSFVLNCGTSTLVVPLRGHNSVWVYVNGELVKINPKKVFINKKHVIGGVKKCDVCGKIPFEIYYDSSKLIRVYHCSDCDPKEAKLTFKNMLKLIFKSN